MSETTDKKKITLTKKPPTQKKRRGRPSKNSQSSPEDNNPPPSLSTDNNIEDSNSHKTLSEKISADVDELMSSIDNVNPEEFRSRLQQMLPIPSREEMMRVRAESIAEDQGLLDDEEEHVRRMRRLLRVRGTMFTLFSSMAEIENKMALEDLDHTFGELCEKVSNIGNNLFSNHRDLQNHLVQYYHQLDGVIQELGNYLRNEKEREQTGQNGRNQTYNNNRNFEINNEIKLVNFTGGDTANIVEMFSDPDFVTHIVRKDTFKNKYTVIVYDPSWETDRDCQDPVGTNKKLLQPLINGELEEEFERERDEALEEVEAELNEENNDARSRIRRGLNTDSENRNSEEDASTRPKLRLRSRAERDRQNNEEEAATMERPKPVKRGRGRPRKNPINNDHNENVTGSTILRTDENPEGIVIPTPTSTGN